MNIKIVEESSKLISRIFVCLVVGYIILVNLSPFGTQASLSSFNPKQISKLGPTSRVSYVEKDGQMVAQQSDDLVYFSSSMPVVYDHAQVKINFENPNQEQDLKVGFQDKSSWHYQSQLLDSPLIDNLDWNQIGGGPYLFEKNKTYSSLDEFMNNPPTNAVVGIYNADPKGLIDDNARIAGYTPTSKQTVIDTPMRGSLTFYVYVDNEPFHMTVEKQDLNWYDDPDVLSAKVYKGDELVYQADIDDDGVTDNSKRVTKSQTTTIDNPGPGLPEPGIYRVELQTNNDVIVKKITTNLHKIVWQGPLYLASNSFSYPILDQTRENILYTSSLVLSAKIQHQPAIQTMKVGDDNVNLNTLDQEQYVQTNGNVAVSLPQSDAILNGSGFFVFSRDQFFWPTKINFMPIQTQADLDRVDYVLTNYKPNIKEADGSKTAVLDFDLSSAYVANNQLSWAIMAAGLKDNDGKVLIKNIELNLSKKGWFK